MDGIGVYPRSFAKLQSESMIDELRSFARIDGPSRLKMLDFWAQKAAEFMKNVHVSVASLGIDSYRRTSKPDRN
jgi:hypothetical protein